jgi:hypothetical protein
MSAPAGGNTIVSSAEDVEMSMVRTSDIRQGPTGSSTAIPEDNGGVHPFRNKFGDPFLKDPFAGLSAEEREEIENDLEANEEDELDELDN